MFIFTKQPICCRCSFSLKKSKNKNVYINTLVCLLMRTIQQVEEGIGGFTRTTHLQSLSDIVTLTWSGTAERMSAVTMDNCADCHRGVYELF